MTDPEESKQYVGQSVDGDAAVDATLRWRCQGAYASYPVANSDLLDNRSDGRRQHSDEGSDTKRFYLWRAQGTIIFVFGDAYSTN